MRMAAVQPDLGGGRMTDEDEKDPARALAVRPTTYEVAYAKLVMQR